MLADTHKYAYTENKRKINDTQVIGRFHSGLVIIDESHNVIGEGKGPWRILETMRTDRPDDRFWLVAMSDTILTTSSMEILAPMSIMYDASWDDPKHPCHQLRPSALNSLSKVVTKSIEKPKDEDAKQKATEAVSQFGFALPNP